MPVTRLQPEQNTKLYRSYLHEPGFAVSRPRGKSPQQCTFFTRSQRLKEESSFLASVCSLLGVLPPAGTPLNQKALASLSRGELLCQAFEVYQQLMPAHGISFEHAVFLVTALAQGVELTVARCAECGVLCVLNRLDRDGECCTDCAAPKAHNRRS